MFIFGKFCIYLEKFDFVFMSFRWLVSNILTSFSENTIRKTVQVVSVIALIIGASGCATQASGGSKLGHEELANETVQNSNTMEVCTQYGAVKHCSKVDRDRALEDLQYFQDSLR
jgi:hypothetical protein